METANTFSGSLANQIVFDEDESRYILKIGKSKIVLPVLNKKGEKADKDDLLEVSESLHMVLQSANQLVDNERLKTASKSLYKSGDAVLSFSDKKYQDLIINLYPNFPYSSPGKKVDRDTKLARIRNTHSVMLLFRMTYKSNNTFIFRMNPGFNKMLKGTSENPNESESVVGYEAAIESINSLREKINERFIAEGFKATLENRSNLISLILGLNQTLVRNYEITRIIGQGSPHGELNINQPSLIKAAAAGYNDSILKIFYANQYYPTDTEELRAFKNIPYEMLDNILGGRNL